MQSERQSARSFSPRRTSLIFNLLLGFLLCIAINGMVDAQEPDYKFGVFPYLPSVQSEGIYAPIGADLGRALAGDVRFRTSSTFATFADNLRKQVYDIAFVQPFDYATTAAAAGYVPLARVDSVLSGLIVVPRDSPLQKVQDLKGKTLALPPVTAAVSHLAKIALHSNGFDPERELTLRHLPSHTACLHQLVIARAHACVTASSPLRIFQKKNQMRFRTLMKTPPIPSSLFVAHTRVPDHHRSLLQQTMISWHQSERGRQLLQRTQFSKFVTALDADYDIVRRYWKEVLQTCSRDCP